MISLFVICINCLFLLNFTSVSSTIVIKTGIGTTQDIVGRHSAYYLDGSSVADVSVVRLLGFVVCLVSQVEVRLSDSVADVSYVDVEALSSGT